MDKQLYLSAVPARYVVGEELGRGRSGVVFAATDSDTGDPVAVKITPAAIAHDALLSLQRAPCPGVVGVRAVHEAPGVLSVVVMDRVAGLPLVRAIRGEPAVDARPLLFGQPVGEAGASLFSPLADGNLHALREAVRGVAEALEALHDRGYIHGDIQPDNVLVSEAAAVLVDVDGLAAGEIHRPVLATATYMSPEQGRRELRWTSDGYGLGVMLFESLTGGVPFSGSAQEVFVKKQTVRAPRPSFLVGGVPDDLDEITAGLLERSPAHRLAPSDVLARLRSPRPGE